MTGERPNQRPLGRHGEHRSGRGGERRPIDRFADPLDSIAALLFEDRGAGLLVVDPAGLIVRANATLRAMAANSSRADSGGSSRADSGGSSRADFGQSAIGLFAPAQQEKVRTLILAGARGDTTATAERLNLIGQERSVGALVALSMTPLPGIDGTIDGLLLRLTDIAGEARLESEISEGRKMQAIGQMAGGIAHDFNNLLSTILAAADSILARAGVDAASPGAEGAGAGSADAGSADTGSADTGRVVTGGVDSGGGDPGDVGAGDIDAGRVDPDTVDDARHVRLAAERGAALVRRLLAFSRRQPMRPRPVAVNTAITDLAPLLRRLLGAPIDLRLVLEEPGRTVWVDPTQLDQVLVNLAANARDAMPDGGQLTIRTGHRAVYQPETIGGETLPAGRYVLISVEDTGHGIPPDILPRIFEPFFTTRPLTGGTGLGLSTVLGIVRQSGGFLRVDTEPGKGTSFRIVLPRSDDASAVEATTPQPAPPDPVAQPASPTQGRGTVLLVDDEEPLRRLVERALRRTGWNVIAAGSAEYALAALDSAPEVQIAVVVSDVVMPGMDGPTLIATLRKHWPDLPAILVSGYAESMLRGDAVPERVSFLPKPYEMKELLALVAASRIARE